MRYRSLSRFAVVSFLMVAKIAAQIAPAASHWELVALRSGVHANPSPVEGVVYREFVTLPPNTPWLRLYFSRIHLGKGSYLRIASLRDGDVQTLAMQHVEQWQHSSAYFNGNAVLLEIVAGPGTDKNYVEIDKVMAGDPQPVAPEDMICGSTDNRVPSNHPAACRIAPYGCSAFLIDVPATGTDRLLLSAGHCEGHYIAEFDVPASNTDCSIVHPPASKQFAIDAGTGVAVNGGVGNDYWVFRCFPNSTTGLTAFQTQGVVFPLATAIPVTGTTLRNYGFGVDGTPGNNGSATSSCSCTNGNGVRNMTQQTHTGPLTAFSGTTIQYTIDVCGGNSGSALLEEATGRVVAVQTHGGCNTIGFNASTAITHPGLQMAIQAVAGPGGPSNDECAGAYSIVDGLNGPFTNFTSTLSAPFPCGVAVGSDVWFRYVATCSGLTTFDTCSPTLSIDSVLEVYSGTCGNLASLGCSDDVCASGSSVTASTTAGLTYFVRVGSFASLQGLFDLRVTSCNAPDACSGALPLQLGANGPFGNALATNSSPAFACGSGGKDLWFVHQAPPATNLTFTTCQGATNFDTVLEVFAGSCGNLVPLACNDDDPTCSPSNLRSTATVTTGAAATTLYVRVGGYQGASGTFVLAVGQGPVNDDCSSALVLGNGVHGPFSNLGATASSVWPCLLGGADVWFVWQASCTGMLVVDTCSPGRTFDTALEVFSGTCGNLVSLGCNDDACGLGSSLSVPVVFGQNYWIRMGGYYGAQGQAQLAISCVVTGDECVQATDLIDGVNGPFTNTGATTSATPWPCAPAGADVWFRYRANGTTPVTFWTCTPTRTFDTVLEVLDGSCTALASLACNDDYCSLGSRLTINAVNGVTYQIRVGGFAAATGVFDIEVQPGTGSGTIVRQPHGCGPATIQTTGLPRIGGTLTTALGNYTGLPFLGFGFQPGATPFCGTCTIGHEWAIALFGALHQLNVPLDASLIGVTIAVQGLDFTGAGGCPSPPLVLTDTMVITIG